MNKNRVETISDGVFSIVSYLIGILFSFIYLPATVFLYLFPMLFNIIPGTLNFAEKHLNLDFG